ncbi:hypothetical protein E2C01_041065 [Portunus trituberculatus]|uniref:Uncharacterized protein n=1 Tax=Portunus trituberculatus TaxID=210409 RepID=A0A5B7FSI4_PORTR|nr:hypothetical protein [Portunus trituberculatus]
MLVHMACCEPTAVTHAVSLSRTMGANKLKMRIPAVLSTVVSCDSWLVLTGPLNTTHFLTSRKHECHCTVVVDGVGWLVGVSGRGESEGRCEVGGGGRNGYFHHCHCHWPGDLPLPGRHKC